MSKSTHTPGPWAVHGFSANIVPAIHLRRPIGGAEDDAFDLANYAQEICALHYPDRHRPESETRANARMIAAAPELLRTLQQLHDDIAEYASINNLGGFDNHCMRQAREAIAKATGAA